MRIGRKSLDRVVHNFGCMEGGSTLPRQEKWRELETACSADTLKFMG